MSIALLKSIRKFSIQWIPAPSLISGFMKRFPPVTSGIQPMTLWGREKNKKTAGNLLLVCITCKTWFRAPDDSLPHGPHNYSWAYHDTCALRMGKGNDISECNNAYKSTFGENICEGRAFASFCSGGGFSGYWIRPVCPLSLVCLSSKNPTIT